MNKELIEERIDLLFFDDRLVKVVKDVLYSEDVESLEEFIDEMEWRIERDFNEDLRWLILRNYCTIENIEKVDFDVVEKEFFEDLKVCFLGE